MEDVTIENLPLGGVRIETGHCGDIRIRQGSRAIGVTATALPALIAALQAALPDGGWLPIESAPKDGSHFLAWEVLGPMDEYDDDENLIGRGKYQRQCAIAYCPFPDISNTFVTYPWNGGISSNARFTHWQPLPPPPSNQGEGR